MIASVTTNPCIDFNVQVDELIKNQTTRSKGELLLPGGNGVNVARTATLLGDDVKVTAYGFAGGKLGELLKSMLDAEGVAHDFLDTGIETRINLLVSLTPDRSLVRVNTAGPEVTEEHGKALLKQLVGLGDLQYVVLGGSLPGRKLPPPLPRDYYARVIDELKLKKKDVKVILDSRDMALGHGVDKGPFLVKPNEVEMARLAGRQELETEKDLVAAAERLIGRYGVGYFVISRGERGCLVVGGDLRLRVNAAEQVSLTRPGAGDAFVGGLVWALAKGQSVEDAARTATAVGTATVLSEATHLFRKEEVDKLLPKTTVERL